MPAGIVNPVRSAPATKQVTIAGEPVEMAGFTYDGTLPVTFLRRDEMATPTNGPGHLVIGSPRGTVRLAPGDFISRLEDGSLFTTSSSHPQGGASVERPRGPAADAPSGGCEHCSCVRHEGAACCECEYAPKAGKAA